MSVILSVTTDRKLGGIAQMLVSYSQACARYNMTHVIILPRQAAILPALRQLDNVQIVAMPVVLIRLHLLTSALFHTTLKKMLSGARAIFVHNARLAASMQNFVPPCFVICHSGKLRYLNRAGHVICLTRAAVIRAENTLDRPKLHLLAHGIEVAKKVPARKRGAATAGPVKLIAAGRFVQKKGFDCLLAAAEILQAQDIKFHLVIYGEGPLKADLLKDVNDKHLTSVSIKGWCHDMQAVFAEADLFCLPSREEPFGLILCEAMAAGLPVVASKTDGPLDILGHRGTGQNMTLQSGGILVDCEDVQGLARALAFFCLHPKMLRLAGEAGHKRVKEAFSHEQMADGLYQLLDRWA